MKERIILSIENHFSLKDKTLNLTREIEEAARTIISVFEKGGTLYICGNGGSAADSQHFAAELAGRFAFDRPPLPAVALTANTSSLTCIANDYSYEEVFARQIEALAGKRDALFAVSTSGNSRNMVRAIETARKKGCPVISLLGSGGGVMRGISDISICVDCQDTANIQEIHIFIIHTLCRLIEVEIFGRRK